MCAFLLKNVCLLKVFCVCVCVGEGGGGVPVCSLIRNPCGFAFYLFITDLGVFYHAFGDPNPIQGICHMSVYKPRENDVACKKIDPLI